MHVISRDVLVNGVEQGQLYGERGIRDSDVDETGLSLYVV